MYESKGTTILLIIFLLFMAWAININHGEVIKNFFEGVCTKMEQIDNTIVNEYTGKVERK